MRAFRVVAVTVVVTGAILGYPLLMHYFLHGGQYQELAVVYLIVTYDTDVGEYLEKYPITSMEVAGQRFEFGVMAMNSAFNVAQFVERTPQDTPEAKSAVVNQVQVQEQLSRKAAELGVIPSKTIEGVRVDEAEEEELLAKEAKLVPPIASQDSKNFKWVSQLGIS